MSTQTLSEDEIGQLRTLIEVEKIRKKETLYSHMIDSLDLESWAELLAEDVVVDWAPVGRWHGRAAIHDHLRGLFEGRSPYTSLHMTTNPWIEITGPTSATSRSYLQTINTQADPACNPVKALGLYELGWEKIDGDWKIRRHWFRAFWPERGAADDMPGPMVPSPIG